MKKKKTRRATRAFYAGLSYLSPRWNTKLLYLRKFGRLPDLKHPQTLNEKLLKQKLERFGTDPVVRQCADKYRVRDYVDGCGCGGTLNRLLAVYDRPEDIDWDALPALRRQVELRLRLQPHLHGQKRARHERCRKAAARLGARAVLGVLLRAPVPPCREKAARGGVHRQRGRHAAGGL